VTGKTQVDKSPIKEKTCEKALAGDTKHPEIKFNYQSLFGLITPDRIILFLRQLMLEFREQMV
jgi:hypothetical protein